MYITVKEALQLERLQHFRPVAGQKGLHRKIEKISLLDYEVVNRIEGQFLKNEFALSSLLGAKDDPALILGSVKYLVQSGVSGLAVKNIYFDQLPKEVIDYADTCDFPIFIFDNSVFFEDIITDAKDALRDLEKGAEFEYQLPRYMPCELLDRKKHILQPRALLQNSSAASPLVIKSSTGRSAC